MNEVNVHVLIGITCSLVTHKSLNKSFSLYTPTKSQYKDELTQKVMTEIEHSSAQFKVLVQVSVSFV